MTTATLPPLRTFAERNALVEANLGLVGSVIRSMLAGLPHLARHRDDLFQAGCLGLLRSAELYDEAQGATFATYAVPWIQQAVARHHADHGELIRISSRVRGTRRRELARRLRAFSLSRHHANETALDVADPAGPAGATVERDEIASLVREALGTLNRRQRQVIELLVYEGLTAQETGRRIGVGRTRVGQIEHQARVAIARRCPGLADLVG